MWFLWLGCVLRAPELVGMEVASAELDLTRSQRGAWMFGGTAAHGWLRVTGADGEVLSIPVRAGGPSFGVMFGLDQSIERSRWHTTTRVTVPGATKGQHLVGWYGGNSASGAFMLGKRWRSLRNRHGVRIEETGPVLGMSMWVGWDGVWLRPIERGELLLETSDRAPCVEVSEPLPEGIGHVPGAERVVIWSAETGATIEVLDAPMSWFEAHEHLLDQVGEVPFTVASVEDCHVLAWLDAPDDALVQALGQVTVRGEPLPALRSPSAPEIPEAP